MPKRTAIARGPIEAKKQRRKKKAPENRRPKDYGRGNAAGPSWPVYTEHLRPAFFPLWSARESGGRENPGWPTTEGVLADIAWWLADISDVVALTITSRPPAEFCYPRAFCAAVDTPTRTTTIATHARRSSNFRNQSIVSSLTRMQISIGLSAILANGIA